MKKYNIYMKVGDFEPRKMDTFKTEKQALTCIRNYERQDRYEHEVEGYGFPYGMPKYSIVVA